MGWLTDKGPEDFETRESKMKKLVSLLALCVSFGAMAHPFYDCQLEIFSVRGDYLTGRLDFYYNVGFNPDIEGSVAYPVTDKTQLKYGGLQVIGASEVSDIGIERIPGPGQDGIYPYQVDFTVASLRTGDDWQFVETGVPSGQSTNFAEYVNQRVSAKAWCKLSF